MSKKSRERKEKFEKLQNIRQYEGLVRHLSMKSLVNNGVLFADKLDFPDNRWIEASFDVQAVCDEVVSRMPEKSEHNIFSAFHYGSDPENEGYWIDGIRDSVKSPFSRIWLEFTTDTRLFGVYVTSKDYSNFMHVFCIPKGFKQYEYISFCGYMECYHDYETGFLQSLYSPDDRDIEALVVGTVVALRTLEFINYRNIVIVDAPAKPVEEALHQRYFKAPMTKFKVLAIKSVSKRYGSNSPQQQFDIIPLHGVRGHERRALNHPVPQFRGVLYIPPHARGDEKNGVVVKDYKVLP